MTENNVLVDIFKTLMDPQGIRSAIEIMMNLSMQFERTQYLKAQPYERTEERSGYANGFKDKTLKTPVGTLSLKIPQVRNGEFYPSALERGCRTSRALMMAIAEMYFQGLSTGLPHVEIYSKINKMTFCIDV